MSNNIFISLYKFRFILNCNNTDVIIVRIAYLMASVQVFIKKFKNFIIVFMHQFFIKIL